MLREGSAHSAVARGRPAWQADSADLQKQAHDLQSTYPRQGGAGPGGTAAAAKDGNTVQHFRDANPGLPEKTTHTILLLKPNAAVTPNQ